MTIIVNSTFTLIFHDQRNQTGSSPAMEFEGFKSCMEFLIGYGLLIKAFVSDRHVSIAAHMRKSLSHITHYFDIWHLKKSKLTYSGTSLKSLFMILGLWRKICQFYCVT